MSGDLLMKCLVAFYVLLASVYGLEQNWAKMCYWLSAAGISLSVLAMK